MKVQVEQMPAAFVPVKLEIVIETKKERDLLLKLMSRHITVPEFIQQQDETEDLCDEQTALGILMCQIHNIIMNS